MTVGVSGRAGAADKVLTVNNLLFTGEPSVKKGREYWEYSITGLAAWRNYNSGTPIIYTMNTGTTAQKLFSIA